MTTEFGFAATNTFPANPFASDRRRLSDAGTGGKPGGALVRERSRAAPRYDPYGVFGVLYSTSFWNGFQTVS